MARKAKIQAIEFDSPATVDEMISALTELREQVGGDATVHVVGWMEINANGSRVRKIVAVPAEIYKARK